MTLFDVIVHRWTSAPRLFFIMIMLAPWMASLPVSAQGSLQVICAPDTPIAHVGESITLRAWAVEGESKPVTLPLDWAWSASAGTITGGDIAIWSFGPLDGPDEEFIKSTATVTAQSEVLGRASCELRITLAWPVGTGGTRGSGSESIQLSGRTFLLPEEKEPKGYGLYSYLLFGSRPIDDAERARYLGAIESYLQLVHPVAEMERYCNCKKLNLTMLPIKQMISLPDNFSDQQVAESAKQILAAYDYARAQVILAAQGRSGVHGGPYLVSTMPAGSNENGVVLHFDMSRVVPSLIPDWLRTYCALVTQEHSWNKIKLKKLALNTRNALAVMSRDTPEVITALIGWIQVLRKR